MTDKQLLEQVNSALQTFEGDCHEMESAVGALFLGRQFGWKPLFLIHRPSTIRKYEEYLGITFRDVMPDVGPFADKSNAWRALGGVSSFWKAVKGEIPGVRSSQATK